MRLRALLVAAVVAGWAAAPSPAPPPVAKGAPGGDRPAVTFQVKSVAHVLDDIKAGIKYTAGPLGDRFLDEFNRDFEKTFGKEGFDGIDVTKPAGGYMHFGDTPEEIQVVLLFPTADEKKVVALVNRTMFRAEAVGGKPGLYKVDIPGDPAPFPIRLRLHDGYAYVGFNVADAGMAPTALVSAAKVIDPLEKATLVARGLPGKVPAAFYKNIRELLVENLTEAKRSAERFEGKWAADLIGGFEGLILQGLGHLETSTDALTWRLSFDRTTATFTDEETYTPKVGTPFAEEIAKWGPTVNRFAGLADDKAAAWGVTKFPVFNANIRTIATALLDGAEKEYPKVIPESGHALVKEAIALGKRTVAKGEGDLGVVLHGPDKDGKFTLVCGVAADDPSGVEKELKALAKTVPVKDVFAFDVAKVGDVAVHEAKVGALLPPEMQKVFGEKAVVCLGVGKDVLYAAIGPDARAKVTAAAGMKLGPAAAFDARYNPAKLTTFVKLVEEEMAGHVANGLGSDDKMVPFWTTTVTGGTELTVKQTSNILTPYRVMFFVMEGLFR
jgi:hypothetical protein